MARKTTPHDSTLAASSRRENLSEAPAPHSVQTELPEIQLNPASEQDAATEALRQELFEVRELARSLVSAVQEVKSQSARNEVLRSAIQDVKSDVRAASQAAMMVPTTMAASPYVDAHGAPREGKCGPCECVSDGCCCFDIVISRVRVAKPQVFTEAMDMGDIPFLKNALEIRLYFTVDGTGFLWPGLATSMEMRADGAPGGPGPWIDMGCRTVKRVCFPRGTKPTYVLKVEGQEVDEGVAEALMGKDEYGEGEGMITLDCCVETIYPAGPVEVYLQHGGEGRGMVEVSFMAKRVCC
jgi:hypothetical protein